MRSPLALALAAALVAGTPAIARAQVAPPPPPPAAPALGAAKGQLLLTSDLALDLHRVTVREPGAESVTSTSYDLRAGFDRVVWPRLTVGLWLGLDGELRDLDQRKRFALGARAGGLFGLGATTAWWPSLGFGYGITEVADRSTTSSLRTWTLTVASPLLWQPTRHVLLGAGPVYATDVKAKTGPTSDELGTKTSSLGLHGLIGMWF